MITWHSRDELPYILNSAGLVGIGVEVGVQSGINAAHIRQHWDGKLLIGVDPWRAYQGSLTTQDKHEVLLAEASARLTATGKDFTFVRKTSLDAAKEFADVQARFDWVYLDADHAYASVRDDLCAWWPLVKPGGILAGHDFIPDGWRRVDEPPHIFYPTKEEGGPSSFEFGVIRAVKEFSIEAGIDYALTAPDDCSGWRSYLFQKPAVTF